MPSRLHLQRFFNLNYSIMFVFCLSSSARLYKTKRRIQSSNKVKQNKTHCSKHFLPVIIITTFVMFIITPDFIFMFDVANQKKNRSFWCILYIVVIALASVSIQLFIYLTFPKFRVTVIFAQKRCAKIKPTIFAHDRCAKIKTRAKHVFSRVCEN